MQLLWVPKCELGHLVVIVEVVDLFVRDLKDFYVFLLGLEVFEDVALALGGADREGTAVEED